MTRSMLLIVLFPIFVGLVAYAVGTTLGLIYQVPVALLGMVAGGFLGSYLGERDLRR